MADPGLTAFIQNLSGSEMIVILIVALVVLGPERLPELARGAGRMMHKLRTMTEGFQSEMQDVMDDPSMQHLRELGELAARPRQKLTQYALEAEAEERARKEAEVHDLHEAAVAEAEEAERAGAVDSPGEPGAGEPGAGESETTEPNEAAEPSDGVPLSNADGSDRR